jgi:hypothetical protein
MTGEIEPMVGVEDGSRDVEKVDRARDTGLFTATMETQSEENAPKEA